MEPTFGERLTDWLKFLDLRQADLARALGISKAAVHGWMSGESAPSTDRLVPIVTALGIRGGVAEFFARMPMLEADVGDEAEDRGTHPKTGDITRLQFCPQCGARMGAHREPCSACGYRREAA